MTASGSRVGFPDGGTLQVLPLLAYTHRHLFVTDALENGVGVGQVAERLGHTFTDIVMIPTNT
jgi:integrase